MRFITTALIVIAAACSLSQQADAQVYQWEYVDPADPSLGKKRSSVFAADGAGVVLTNVTGMLGRNLTKAYLHGAQMPRYRVSSTNFTNGYLAGANLFNLQGQDLIAEGADFTGANLASALLQNSLLSGAVFVGADLSGSRLSNARLANADFTDANIAAAEMNNVTTLGFSAPQLYSTASYKNKNLGAMRFQQNDMRGWSFKDMSMVGADFDLTQLEGADFQGAEIRDAIFSRSTLSATQLYSTASYQAGNIGRVDFTAANLAGWDFSGVSMRLARLTSADLTDTVFDGADLNNAFLGRSLQAISGASFRGADLTNARFTTNSRWQNADFTGANLAGADLRNSGFVTSTFEDAIIRGANLEYVTNWGFTLENLYQTASYRNADLTATDLSQNNWSGGDFRGVDLTGASFGNSILDGADFRGVTAVGANFSSLSAALHSVNFDGANLREAIFSYRSTSGGLSFPRTAGLSFRGADLSYVQFTNATMEGVDLTDANIYGATFMSLFDGLPNSIDLTKEQLYSTVSYKAHSLGPIRLKGDFTGWDFSGQDLTGAGFLRYSLLTDAHWDGATLTDAYFYNCTMPGANFTSAVLDNVEFSSSDLSRSNFQDVDMTGTSFSSASLVDARLDGVIWRNGDAQRTDLSRANLTGADLRGARFYASTLTDVNFTDADIRNAMFEYPEGETFAYSQLKSTRSYLNRDLTGITLEGIDLPSENFVGFVMPGFTVGYGNLSGSDFDRAELTGADFRVVNLTDTSFRDANLTQASFNSITGIGTVDFTGAIITGVSLGNTTTNGFTKEQLYSTSSYQTGDLGTINLRNANIAGWDLREQDLRGADLSTQSFGGALYGQSDLRGATVPRDLRTGSIQSGGAALTHAILPDGTLDVLYVITGETLRIRNAPEAVGATAQLEQIRVLRGARIEAGGSLSIEFDENPWKSTLLIQNVPIELEGVLELGFEADVDLLAQVGRSFRLFNWAPVAVQGQFEIVSDPRLTWDVSQLYSGGIVTLVAAVPEPTTLFTAVLGVSGLLLKRRRLNA